jgi:hypothetical protein
MQEMFVLRVFGIEREGANPGCSARSRYAARENIYFYALF